MARALSAFCCFVVLLQILIGVPLAVCLAFFFVVGGGMGPLAVEVHSGHGQPPHLLMPGATIPPPGRELTMTPPPNVIPTTSNATLDNPILQSRAQQGSPLAGTVMDENVPAGEELEIFVGGLEKAIVECVDKPTPIVTSSGINTVATPETDTLAQQADQFAVDHLYEMADKDERAGNFDRADQWRAQARDIRQSSKPTCPAVAETPEASSSTSASSF
jgi:hypothetical protein